MIIHDMAFNNFTIDYTNDSAEIIMLKQFYKNHDRISRQIASDERERERNFDKKYNKIMKLNNLQDLKSQITAIDELLSDKRSLMY